MNGTTKIIVSVLGMVMLSVSTVYGAHSNAPIMAYVASSCASVGAYLVGLFQARPA